MPLSAPTSPRQPLHTRSIRVQSYVREDGQWDIEAELIDTKSYTFPLHGGREHLAGVPVHHMHLRVTIDMQFTITDAQVAYDAAPYGELCSAIAPKYGELIGLNLLKQFRQRVRERFGRAAGCSHITELANILPTVAVQTMASERQRNPERREQTQGSRQRPFQLDGCHALRTDGPVVQKHYAPWYVPPVDPHEG